jgi:hypothetical protein
VIPRSKIYLRWIAGGRSTLSRRRSTCRLRIAPCLKPSPMQRPLKSIASHRSLEGATMTGSPMPVSERSIQGMQPTPFAEALAEPVSYALGTIHSALNQNVTFDPSRSRQNFTIAMADIGEIHFFRDYRWAAHRTGADPSPVIIGKRVLKVRSMPRPRKHRLHGNGYPRGSHADAR